MPAKCVKMKMKQGMSAGKAVAACYPKATKAVKKAAIAAIPGVGAAVGIKRAMDIREIKKSKPKKLSIRKTSGPIEKSRRRQKAKSIKKGY
jgi:hypothetical protein